MQTTLLGIGIAIIVALVAALVGPLFVDWDHYRAEFESSARHLTGLDFRVGGRIDARLLPTPTLVLHDIAFGRSDEVGQVRARALRIEFALGALVRGEWRVADARLEGPQFAASLDRSGQLTWPVSKLGFDVDGVSIDRLTIEDGRAVFADAASDTRLTLEKLEFKGEVRSLAGPAKGEGSFVVAGQHYPYRLAMSRIADGNLRTRLSIDPIDRPLTFDADVSVSMDRGVPRFDGNIQLARPVARPSGNGQSLISEPWRVASHIKGDSVVAVLEQVEFQYGPDDRAIKLKGSANVAFGTRPQINGVVSSTQIDLDRLLGLPEATRHQPVHAIKAAAESLFGGLRLPIPATLSIGVDSMTLAGATLQRVGAEVTTDDDGLDIRSLEFRGPGLSQVGLSGRLAIGSAGVRFGERTAPAHRLAHGPHRCAGDCARPVAPGGRCEAWQRADRGGPAQTRVRAHVGSGSPRLCLAEGEPGRAPRRDVDQPRARCRSHSRARQGHVRRCGFRMAARRRAFTQDRPCRNRRCGEQGRRRAAADRC